MSSRSICVRSGLPGPEELFLADEFVERLRTHPVGERPACERLFFGLDGVKKSHEGPLAGSGWRPDSRGEASLIQASTKRQVYEATRGSRTGAAFWKHQALHGSQRLYFPLRRCRAASKSTIDAAIPAFSDSTDERIGIEIVASAECNTSWGRPAPSLPINIAAGSRRSDRAATARAMAKPVQTPGAAARGHDFHTRHFQLREQHRNRNSAKQRQSKCRTGRRTQSFRRPGIGRAARRDRPGGSKRFGGAHDRPDISGVLHARHDDHECGVTA